jgi:hypothetical protein
MSVLLIIAVIVALWVAMCVLLVTLCRMAAQADAAQGADVPPDQTPRRPNTWGTVRKRIFTSPQSDQFATYK